MLFQGHVMADIEVSRFPPGIKRPSQDPPQPILQDFEDFDVQKQKHVAGREYWYFNLIGRMPGRTERGKLSSTYRRLASMRTLVFRLWLRLVWEEELLMRKAIRLKEERELWSMA
jgi:hypothetical protein